MTLSDFFISHPDSGSFIAVVVIGCLGADDCVAVCDGGDEGYGRQQIREKRTETFKAR